MKYRVWDLDQDYPILEKWCKERAFDSVMPKEMLPKIEALLERKGYSSKYFSLVH